MEGWLEVIKDIAKTPALIQEIYGDLLKPGVKQVGKALESVIGLGNTILWPLTLANECARIALERNMEKYRSQLQDVPEEKVILVAPEIGVPIAEKISYVSDEQLSDLYINLIAKASTIDTARFAHPSFVNIINNFCPDEAILLKEIRHQERIAFLSATLVKRGTKTWKLVDDLLTGLEMKVNLSFPGNISAYFSNFEGLGLVQIRRDIYISQPELYNSLDALYCHKFESIDFDRNMESFEFKKGKIEITPYGALFMTACLTRLNAS